MILLQSLIIIKLFIAIIKLFIAIPFPLMKSLFVPKIFLIKPEASNKYSKLY